MNVFLLLIHRLKTKVKAKVTEYASNCSSQDQVPQMCVVMKISLKNGTKSECMFKYVVRVVGPDLAKRD